MTWASPDTIEANDAGRITEKQRAELHRIFVAPKYPQLIGLALVAGLGGSTLFSVEGAGLGLILCVVAAVWAYALFADLVPMRRDLAAGVVENVLVHLAPASDRFVRAPEHVVRVDGKKLTFGHLDHGTFREWFAPGGTFRFYYLPRTGRVVLYLHVEAQP